MGKSKLIRCQTPQDVIVVDSHETAKAICQTKTPCHPHLVIVGEARFDTHFARLQAVKEAAKLFIDHPIVDPLTRASALYKGLRDAVSRCP